MTEKRSSLTATMTRRRGARRENGGCIIIVCVVLILGGCGDPPVAGVTTGPVARAGVIDTWSLEASPLVEIGEADGDEHYLFHDIVSVVRLPNGNIAVLDAGSAQLRFYDGEGRHLRTTGGEGSGPGEYRAPARLYLTHEDSLQVFDSRTRMETTVDTAGTFVRAVRYETREDETFTRDAWLYGRMLVDGPMLPVDRRAVRGALDRIPQAMAADSFTFVIIDGFGRPWARAEPHDPEQSSRWLVYGPDGDALATVRTPARFQLQHIGARFLAGRGWDTVSVERVQVFAYDAPDPTARPHRSHVLSADAPAPESMPDDTRRAMQSVLRNAMTQQEIFYSKSYHYAWRADQLEWPDDMKGLTVHITASGPSGYTILLFHASITGSCGVAVGTGGPVGWVPGVVSCT
jgi:hypothetical protein